MKNDDLTRLGIFQESRLDFNVHASIVHVTPEAGKVQVEVAKQHVLAVRARYEIPVRVTMQYLLAAIVILLVFILVVLILSKFVGIDSNLAIAAVVVAGATVATPLGILLSKIAAQLLPGVAPQNPDDKKD